MTRLATLASIVLLSLAPPAFAQDGGGATRDLAQRLRDGHIEVVDVEVQGESVRWGRATAIVESRPENVWSVVTDYARYADFLPHFRASRILSRRGNSAIVYLEAAAVRETITLWSQMRIREMPQSGATQIIQADMTQGNVDRMAARWEVTPIDNGARCIVTFQFVIDPDLPFPSSVINSENRKSARKTIEALRRRVTTLASNG